MASPTAIVLGATSSEVETAAHAQQGRRHADAGRFHDAIAEYRKAYELKADPEFLFAIAGCYRHLGNSERALFFYQRYLTAAPTGANHVEAEQAVAALGPRALTAPRPLADQPLAPSLSNDVVLVPLPPQPPPRRPHAAWTRWWVWSVTAVVLLGVATTAVLISRGNDDRTMPPTALGNMRF
ncbi:MAG TPA: hypothetical protein VH374_18060 [Polyangia bacterium]|nr:hypothetical protein [Polyangia bacterium]